jgi:Protein of unknown function (DUF3237)
MELRHLIDISVDVLPPDLLGEFPEGERRLIRFRGGTFEGADGLRGVLADGGRVASAEVAARIAAGEPVDPSEYYFRTFIRLGTASARHERLNRVLAVAWGERTQSTVHIHVHEVL